MSDEKPLVDKVLAGEVSIDQCNLDTDFTVDDLAKLLRSDIIEPEDVSGHLAVELIRSGAIHCVDYPFEDLEPACQLDLLESDEIDAESFLESVNLETYSGADWLRLVVCCHNVETQAPWEKIREEATAEEWVEAVTKYPYLMKFMGISSLQKCSLEQLNSIQQAVDSYLKLAKRIEDEKKEQEKVEFLKPENDTEKAIMAGDIARTLYAMIDHEGLTRPDVLVTSKFLALPKAIAIFVLQNGLGPNLWRRSITFWQKHPVAAAKLSEMMTEAEEATIKEVSDGEKSLLTAIQEHADDDIHSLIFTCGIQLSFSPYLLDVVQEFLHLKKKTLVNLLSVGVREEAKPVFLRFLLIECSDGDMLKELSYKQRLMITNLMIHIMAGQITPDDERQIEEDWYPMGNSIVDGADSSVYCHSYSYYYDPRHIYEPRNADDDDYEKPSHDIRREE